MRHRVAISSAWLIGRTRGGRTVLIDEDPYLRDRSRQAILIDGEAAGDVHVSRLRDGGTTTVRTDRGMIHYPRRAGADNPPPTLDGEELLPVEVRL